MILALISALFMMLDIGNAEASSKIFVFTMGFFSKNMIVKKE